MLDLGQAFPTKSSFAIGASYMSATILLENSNLTSRTWFNSVTLSRNIGMRVTFLWMFSPIFTAFWTEFCLAFGTSGSGSWWFALHLANCFTVWRRTPFEIPAQKYGFVLHQVKELLEHFFVDKLFHFFGIDFTILTIGFWAFDLGFSTADFIPHILSQTLQKPIEFFKSLKWEIINQTYLCTKHTGTFGQFEVLSGSFQANIALKIWWIFRNCPFAIHTTHFWISNGLVVLASFLFWYQTELLFNYSRFLKNIFSFGFFEENWGCFHFFILTRFYYKGSFFAEL